MSIMFFIWIVLTSARLVLAQKTTNGEYSNTFESRLLALEEENRRLGRNLQGK